MERRMGADVLQSIRTIRDASGRDVLLDVLPDTAKPLVVSFVNAHAFNMAWSDPAFAADLCGADMLLRDGVGVAVMMRALGREPGVNMNGTDLIPQIVARFAGKRVALCGSVEPYLGKAADYVRALGCEVVLTKDGFLAPQEYAKSVAAAKPDLVILAMGMPKQEAVAALLKETLHDPVVIVNGGAIVDFWAQRFPRAPLLWQRMQMEWLFRLLQEPQRLWRRYLLGGVVFVVHIAQLKWR
jgi:exopolysaccharide biosynthesis WecB/TagA/CpsF family protein